MKFILFVCIILLSSCEYFYDEDYKNFKEVQDISRTEDISYESDLQSTDPIQQGLKGSVRIDFKNDDVIIKMSAEEIPSTITQLHYDFTVDPCPVVSIYTTESSDTKSFEINETLSKESFDNHLKLRNPDSDDINLQSMYFIVKAFSYLPTSPDPTNVSIIILCGPVNKKNDVSSPDDDVLSTILNPSSNELSQMP